MTVEVLSTNGPFLRYRRTHLLVQRTLIMADRTSMAGTNWEKWRRPLRWGPCSRLAMSSTGRTLHEATHPFGPVGAAGVVVPARISLLWPLASIIQHLDAVVPALRIPCRDTLQGCRGLRHRVQYHCQDAGFRLLFGLGPLRWFSVLIQLRTRQRTFSGRLSGASTERSPGHEPPALRTP